jgi:hypothetical protein
VAIQVAMGNADAVQTGDAIEKQFGQLNAAFNREFVTLPACAIRAAAAST